MVKDLQMKLSQINCKECVGYDFPCKTIYPSSKRYIQGVKGNPIKDYLCRIFRKFRCDVFLILKESP